MTATAVLPSKNVIKFEHNDPSRPTVIAKKIIIQTQNECTCTYCLYHQL